MIHPMLMAGIILLGLSSTAEVSMAAGRSASPLALARPGAPSPHAAQNIAPRMSPAAHAFRRHFEPLALSRFNNRFQQFPLSWGYPSYDTSAYPPEYPAPTESGP